MQHKWEIMQHKWQIIQYKWETIHKKKNTNWNYTIRMKKHKQHIKHGMKITVYTWNIDKEMFIQMKFIQNKTKYKFMQYKWKLNKRNEKQCNTN